MSATARHALIIVSSFALLALASESRAVDLLGGKVAKLAAGPTPSRNKAAIRFSGDPAIDADGAQHDPRCSSGLESRVELSAPGRAFGPIALPCGSWSGAPGFYRYKDKHAGAGGVRSIKFTDKKLDLRFRGNAYQALLGPLPSLDVRFEIGAMTLCGRFESFKANRATRIRASGPTVACSPASTTTTTVTSTTLPTPACGNGVVEPGEQCDDGNVDAGDCCSASCDFEAAGSACAGDGNPCTDDACDDAGLCQHAANDANTCSDANECTGDDRCEGGICVGDAVAPWINEVNYDGYDVLFPLVDHEEFVEIAAPAGIDLGGYQLLAVEGTGYLNGLLLCDTGLLAPGEAYFSATLPAGTVVPDDSGTGVGFVTVCFEHTSGDIAADSGCDVVVTGVPSIASNLKNGAIGNGWDCPDGALLLDPSGALVDAVSWEGHVPDQGAYGSLFAGAPDIGTDLGAFSQPRRSLAKVSSELARETDPAKWQHTPTAGDTPGALNPSQTLTCHPEATDCGNGFVEFGEDCEIDAHCGSGWHCVGCWCEPATGASYTMTEYPIVLVHGFLGFDSLLGVDYWFGIIDALEAGGATVFVAELSQANSIEARGEQLVDQIEELVAITGLPMVNLIGHSQGALDIRYAAGVRPDLVASVTSVAGPHQGVDLGDAFIDPSNPLFELAQDVIQALADLIAWLSGSSNPNDVEAALENFTQAGVTAFNASYPQGLPTEPCGEGPHVVNGIRYYSWSGTGTNTTGIDPADTLFALTSLFFDEANDGLVERCSSHLGRVLRDDYFHNHLDEVNQFFGIVPLLEDNPKSIFRDHANRLKNAGL